VASWLPDVDRLRWAFSDITLVLMTSAILIAPEKLFVSKIRLSQPAGCAAA
jgi:hypothetical protein